MQKEYCTCEKDLDVLYHKLNMCQQYVAAAKSKEIKNDTFSQGHQDQQYSLFLSILYWPEY